MKIKNRKNKLSITPSIVIAIVLLGALVSYVFVYRSLNSSTGLSQNSPSTTTNSSKPTGGGTQAQEQSAKEEPINTDKPVRPTESSTGGKQQIQVEASVSVSGDSVYIRGGINIPTQDGSCHATLTGPSQQSFRKDTIALQNPSSTDCKTIVIPKSELASGTWRYTLHYESNNYIGVSDESSFSI